MKIKIALLQIRSHGLDQKQNLIKGEEYIKRAAKLGADIVLFPEMWNIGYASFDDEAFDQRFDPENISEDLKQKISEWYLHAIDLDSDFINHLRTVALENKIALVITFLQKGLKKPFNSAALIDMNGDIVMTYSKVHTCDFSMEYFCESGSEFLVCELETKAGKVKVGIMICFDREFPESARELMLLGAELILVPNACEMDSHRTAQLKTRAFENMIGIALANYPSPNYSGRSQAYSPIAYSEAGEEIENLILLADEKEGIFIAEFDLDEIRNYRSREVWGNKFRKINSYKNLK